MALTRLLLGFVALTLSGCLFDMSRPTLPQIDEQARFSIPIPVTDDAFDDYHQRWWRRVAPETIWQPLEQALAANPDLREADDDIAAARARLDQTQAAFGPDIVLGGGAQTQRISGETSNSRDIGIDGSVPIDINNALAEQRRAARYFLVAALAERDQLQSDLARDYLLAVLDSNEAKLLTQLIEQQLEAANTLLKLTELRFTQGLASSVDVLQQRDQLAGLRQQIPIARLNADTADNRLRLIAARTPGGSVPAGTDDLPAVSKAFVDAKPVALLQRRGLLRAGQARINAADARFGEALADRWPTLNISGGLLRRVSSGDYTSIVSAALDAAFPLFDSGARKSVAAERRAELAAAGEQYLGDWLTVVIEVDDLLLEEASLVERIELSNQRLASSRALLAAAQRRYEQGISDYLPVLEALSGLQQQQRDHLALRASLARTRIRLHHALGDQPAKEQA